MFSETEIKPIVAISVLLAATKCTKFVFGRGSAPDPAGKLTTLPRPPSRLGRGHPLPIPLPLVAYGASILTPSAFVSAAPRFHASFRHFFFHSLRTGYHTKFRHSRSDRLGEIMEIRQKILTTCVSFQRSLKVIVTDID